MNRIKELRKEINMTQSELAKKLNVAQNTISNWENESRDIDNESLVKLSEIFEVSTDYILCNTDIRDIKKAPTDESRDFDAMIDDISASGEDNEGVVMAKGGKGQKRIIIAEDDDEANFAAEAIKLFRKTKRKK